MGYRHQSARHQVNRPPYNQFHQLYQLFLSGEYDKALSEVAKYKDNKTTKSAYRKVYNYMVKVLENVEELMPGVQKERVDILARLLTRLIIQVEYQKKREVLSDDLADGINKGLSDILQSLRNNNINEASRKAKALRDALDAVLAFVIEKEKNERRGE